MRARLLWLATLCSFVACRADAEPQPEREAVAVASSTVAPDCPIADRSGRDEPIDPASLRDAVATKILAGTVGTAGGCPRTFAEVAAKLEQTDAPNCDGGRMFSAVQTILVSERAQLRRTFSGQREGCTADPVASYRGVTTRHCGGRPAFGLFTALFGLTVSDDALPSDTELIAWDEVAGVFNFYAVEQGTWSFFGSSLDLLRGPAEDGDRRCATCHADGGLVLKEMRSPWVFWEGRDTLPGIGEILEAHPELGSRAAGKVLDLRPAGKELEDAVTAGNAAWTETRVDHLVQHGTLRELLAPVLCSPQFELRAVGQSVSPPGSSGDEDGTLPLRTGELLVDPFFAVDATIGVPLPAYHAALTRANQRVERACGAKLADADGHPIRDAAFDLVYPTRATADEQMLARLLELGVLDRPLAAALLAVDVTRPVFSPLRCDLLPLLPNVPPKQRNAAAIRTELRAAMREQAPTSPAAAALLAALQSSAPTERAAEFVAACRARPPADLVLDVLKEVSRRRELARKTPLIELPEMLPKSDLEAPPASGLDPRTCTFSLSL